MFTYSFYFIYPTSSWIEGRFWMENIHIPEMVDKRDQYNLMTKSFPLIFK